MLCFVSFFVGSHDLTKNVAGWQDTATVEFAYIVAYIDQTG